MRRNTESVLAANKVEDIRIFVDPAVAIKRHGESIIINVIYACVRAITIGAFMVPVSIILFIIAIGKFTASQLAKVFNKFKKGRN